MGIPASSERKALYRGIRIIDAIHPSREFAINDIGDVDRAKFLCFCNLPYAPVMRRDVWFGEVDQDIRVDKNRHPSLVNDRTSSAVIDEIGRAIVLTPVTNAHLVCRLLLYNKNNLSTP